MKFFYRYCFMSLLLGCGAEAPRQPEKRLYYPALNESPPPPAPESPPRSETQIDVIAQPPPPPTTSVIAGSRWIDRNDEKEEMIKRLREYSSKADKDDPFALTEEEILDLSKREDIRIY